MKTERRHELQKNWLADHLGQSVETAKPYTNTLLAIAVAAVVVIGTAWFLWQRSANRREAAWNQYLTARNTGEGAVDQLEQTVGRYPNTQAGHWGLITLADQQLAQGTAQLFEDKEAAKESLQAALENYSRALQAGDEMLILERAAFGVATTREAMGEIEEARKAYQGVIDQFSNPRDGTGLYAAMAKQRLEALNRPAVQDFYAWFSNWTPPKRSPPPTGEKPPADLESLPDTPDLPSAFDALRRPSGSGTGEMSGPAGLGTIESDGPSGLGTTDDSAPAGTGTVDLLSDESPSAELDLPRPDVNDADAPAPEAADDAPAPNAEAKDEQ